MSRPGKWRPLNVGLHFGYLAWSHDRAYVYFDTFLSGDSGYFRARSLLRVGVVKQNGAILSGGVGCGTVENC